MQNSVQSSYRASHQDASHRDDVEPDDAHQLMGVQHLHRAFEVGQTLANTITPKTARTLLECVVVGEGSAFMGRRYMRRYSSMHYETTGAIMGTQETMLQA